MTIRLAKPNDPFKFNSLLLLKGDDKTGGVPLDAEPDVVSAGVDLFTSEEFVETAYKAYLDLMVKNWRGSDSMYFGREDIIVPYQQGLYICGVERAIITHQYDPINDVVPAQFATWIEGVTMVGRELKRVPREWRTAAQGRHFLFSTMKRDDKTEDATVHPTLCTLMADGRIIMGVPMAWGAWQEGARLPGQRLLASMAINLYCDRKHLWQVETSEETVLEDRPTPLALGVSDEHIKSLFYARSLPVTESGRKRPILHWVRAHQRRLAEGIEIDVTRHLRGIDAFEMGGFDWRITNPAKKKLSEKS